MSKKISMINTGDKDINNNVQNLFIFCDQKKLISVTDRAVSLGLSPSYPVMIEHKLWRGYYVSGDTQFIWLNKMLKMCVCFFNAETSIMEFTFGYSYESIVNKQFVCCKYAYDDLGQIYILLTLNDAAEYKIIH